VGKGFQVFRLNDFSANRIKVNVVNDTDRGRGIFNPQGVLSAVKKVPSFTSKPVKPNRKSTLQAVLPIGKMGLQGLQSQMVMVGYDHIGVRPPAKLDGRFPEREFKGDLGTIGGKHGIKVVSAINQKIKSAASFNSQFPRHETS